jgi:putative peptide zinc metalloprotease protein
MNGERTTHEIWETACAELGDDAPSQDETIRLLGMLHGADLLRCDVSPDTAELLRRTQRREHADWWRRYTQPLSIRVPLVDPDAFLERWLPLVTPLFSRGAALAAAGMICVAALLAAAHGPELTANAAERLLTPGNLLLLWLVYPLLKGLHELGHAFATKRWGGEVHEMGILFLVFVPLPYVDASAAAAFSDKWKRVAVGAAGIGVELVVAALAFGVWLAVEPGALRSLAYDVMWIGGASTLLFNGNPLLRFDGYYVLSERRPGSSAGASLRPSTGSPS